MAIAAGFLPPSRTNGGMLRGNGGGEMQKRKRRNALLLVLGVLVLAVWWGNWRLVTQTLAVPVWDLPEALAGLRIAVLSDLHDRTFGQDNARLVRAVAKAEPDLIALCGDLADTDYDPDAVQALAQQLCQIAPVFYVTGNHEWAARIVPQLTEQLTDCGVTVLANDYRKLTYRGASFILAGVHDPNGPYDMKTPSQLVEQIRQENGQTPIVMLSHRNDALDQWAELGVSAVLCGHGHGGVIRLPLLGGLFGPGGEWRPAYTAGLYRQGRTSMAVSRGLGGPLRIGNPPQILIAELQPES